METLRLTPPLCYAQTRNYRCFAEHAAKTSLISTYGRRSFTILPVPYGYFHTSWSSQFLLPRAGFILPIVRSSIVDTCSIQADAASPIHFKKKFPLKRTEAVEGRVSVRLDRDDDGQWKFTVGCSLSGKWILHWGVIYRDDVGSAWDQPPLEMWPPGSVPIKGYAIETPLEQSPSVVKGQVFHELRIFFSHNSSIAAIAFVLKEVETEKWYQCEGRDFKVFLTSRREEDNSASADKGRGLEEGNCVTADKGFRIWPGRFGQLPNILLSNGGSQPVSERNKHMKLQKQHGEGYYEEFTVLKEDSFQNSLIVSVQRCPNTEKNLVHFDTDLPGDVVVHWGVNHDKNKKIWEIPAEPHPPGTHIFRKKALQTTLRRKESGDGSSGAFSLDKDLANMFFVLKINNHIWLNNMGDDFFVPLSGVQSTVTDQHNTEMAASNSSTVSQEAEGADTSVTQMAYTNGIIENIKNLVSDISSKEKSKSKNEESHEKILQEIEKLAAEAYSIFQSCSPALLVEPTSEAETLNSPVKICSGTGSGFEILCQGFNWESHKSGRWYLELNEKVEELSSMGFTIIWLPPPTESVSPEGYMPRDLYNLNSRYGNMEELKLLVNRFHEVGIRVLGDVVLNHRCAHYQNQNGIWNIFGGRLNWDDRAVVADDPHFQGRGNKSSGDSFHAAPNIDHSQDFVRRDLKEWLNWLSKEIGYDGWRLDFVRGFWGGYVKDYLDATEPYFAVGEYWDSLSYTYGNLDHNQDAHRQRIIDWINATTGTAGAFDVTTKGILHAALEKCEYWRLSDDKGKPPGVVGWWPSRAVTFIENHDTGSTQGHWRFPSGKEMQGYSYILTHPGTPAVFYDHIFSRYQHEISELMSLRHRAKIHCRSKIKIIKADRDVYAAVIDDKVAVKIGPGCYDHQCGSEWALVIDGSDYKVWEALPAMCDARTTKNVLQNIQI